MKYFVRAFGYDVNTIACDSYHEALSWFNKIRSDGKHCTIIEADTPFHKWDVSNLKGDHFRVIARSSEEALLKTRYATNDDTFSTVQRCERTFVDITRPDGTTDTLDCDSYYEALKYKERYDARGWAAEIRFA